MAFVIVREDYTHAKPNAEPYLLGLNKFAAKAAETVVIEDSQRGLTSAIAAGIDCLVVHNEFTKSHDFTGAKYLAHSIKQIPELLNT